MVDYSRFDKIGLSSDEEDDEEEMDGPRVYRVGEGESVTIPGRNVHVAHSGRTSTTTTQRATATPPSTSVNIGTTPGDGAEVGAAAVAVPDTALTTPHPPVSSSSSSSSRSPAAVPTVNGAETETYLWSQDATTVTLHAFVPDATRGADVSVAVTRERVEITRRHADTGATGEVVFAGEWFADVEPPEEAEDIDWEMMSVPVGQGGGPQRVVRVTVTKSVVMKGIVSWWKSVVKGGPEIDVESLPGRAKTAAKSQKFLNAFAEAQDMFRKKMEGRIDDRVEVDIGEDD